MAEKGIYKYYKDLPPYVKSVVILGAGVALFFVGKQIYRRVFPSDDEKQNRQLLNDINSEIADAKKAGQVPSFQDSQYMTFANQIYEGMRYAAGDNYDLVEETLKKMNNDVDVAKLIKAFGARQDYAFGIPTGSPKDLFTFVQSELGDDYLGLTNYRISRINKNWKEKGIKYQL